MAYSKTDSDEGLRHKVSQYFCGVQEAASAIGVYSVISQPRHRCGVVEYTDVSHGGEKATVYSGHSYRVTESVSDWVL
ncbi:hypothetical protein Mkiyose1665_57420 [Mycobacterium kiyosense]|nr:hypothetical protein SRL2020411_57730 [Mycobacterium kiyosense]GLD45242.1 hypothetical protein Mkiyose1665_57420 [Mycobacterium kiyosense]